MRLPDGMLGRGLRFISWSVFVAALAALVAAAVVSRRAPHTGAVKRVPADPGAAVGTVHALLRPRGLVAVDGLVEPARWQGETEPPGRGGMVRLTRQSGVGTWDAWPLEGPGEGGANP